MIVLGFQGPPQVVCNPLSWSESLLRFDHLALIPNSA